MPRKTQYIYETTPKKIDYRSPKNRKERGERNNSSRPAQEPLKHNKKKKQVKKQPRKGTVKKQHTSKELKTVTKKANVQKNSTVTYGKAEVASSATKSTKKLSKPKAIVYLLVAFSLLFLIGYRNTVIDQTFVSIQKSKSELELLEKENQQLKIKIEDSVNLDNVAKVATEKLGMKKLTNSQKIYLNLPKRDYIEPASEKVVVEEGNWFTGICKMIQNLF